MLAIKMKRFNLILLLALCSCLSVLAEVMDSTVLYPSVDQFGQPITLSGKLSVPRDRTPKGILLMPHYTVTSNKEVPSSTVTLEEKLFRDEYVIIMPDYLGYGVTSDRVHPYLDGELAARNSVDLLLAMQPVLDSMQLGLPTDSIYIIGASQGGATALWILKLLEEQYAEQIHVIRCFAASGPYDVATTYDDAMKRNKTGLPATIAMLVVGTSEAYNLQLDNDYFFTPAMKRCFNKWIAGKRVKTVPIFFRMPNHRVSHWMKPQAMDRTQPQTQLLYDGLLRSSLVHYSITGDTTDTIVPDWTPQAPLYILHSTSDEIVTFRCAEHLQRCYADAPNITWDFGKYGGHLTSITLFFARVYNLLNE